MRFGESEVLSMVRSKGLPKEDEWSFEAKVDGVTVYLNQNYAGYWTWLELDKEGLTPGKFFKAFNESKKSHG